MRLISKVFVAGLIAVTTASLASAQEKVILDTDFNTLGDDGQVLIMLSQLYGAGKINLLGVTTVSGNQWVDQETADALRAVERLGIQNRVKVYQGAPYPLLHDYTYFNEIEKKIYGFGYAGAFSKPRPTSPDQLKAPIDGFAKTTKVADQNAVDFIVETVKKNPKEVTFLAIGPLTNLALAFRMNPEIVPLVKRIVYMGGAVDVPGNTNPAAEFNWWFDPEAAKIVLSQPIEQTVVGLEVAEKVMFTKAIYDRVVAVDTPITQLYKAVMGPTFQKNPTYSSFTWDSIAAAFLTDPSIATDLRDVSVTMDTIMGPNYGRAMGYYRNAPLGVQKMKILLDINQAKFWDLYVGLVTSPAPVIFK